MKELDTSTNDGAQRTSFAFLQGAIGFTATAVLGAIVTAVVGLFVYANSADPNTRDQRFISVVFIGLCVTLAVAWVVGRRAAEVENTSTTDSELSLLKKYRRSTTKPIRDGSRWAKAAGLGPCCAPRRSATLPSSIVANDARQSSHTAPRWNGCIAGRGGCRGVPSARPLP